MRACTLALAVAGLLQSTAVAAAQDAVQTLGQMKSTRAEIDWRPIEQTGSYSDQLRKNLARVKLPEGFKISLFAVAPDARHMAVGPRALPYSSAPARPMSG